MDIRLGCLQQNIDPELARVFQATNQFLGMTIVAIIYPINELRVTLDSLQLSLFNTVLPLVGGQGGL